ncbi:MAG TPA: hypothetical protein VJV78_44205 [Polyangiales bacterium]|nr:hypothetical protein [Polyangiales bacterium]
MTLVAVFRRVCGPPLLTTLLLLGLSAYYLFVSTSGTFDTIRIRTDFYDLAAEGFRNGHLYIPVEPQALLLAQPDPASQTWRPLWFWDAVLFQRHYYIYWGPVPALLLLAFKLLTGFHGSVSDQWPALFFMLGRLYGGAALIWTFARSLSERPPYWAVFCSILIFGVASPTTFVVARPHIYEASIGAGQCFLFWGLWAALVGLLHRRYQLPAFIFAGLCWALALNSRTNMIVVAPILVVITAAFAWRRSGYAWGQGLRALFSLGIPVGLGLVACFAYNYVRFGSPTEFGLTYQLTGRQFGGGSSAYILPNIVSYLFAELEWSCRFPFARLPMLRQLTSWIEWPVTYDVGAYEAGERVAGLLVTTSWSWLIAVWVWPTLKAAARFVRSGPQAVTLGLGDPALWLVSVSLCSVVSIAPSLFVFMGSMRYLEDPAGGVLIIATIACFWLLRRAQRPVPRALARLLVISVVLHTVVVAVCLGFSGHFDNFRQMNPLLFQRLFDTYSLCADPPR